MLIHDSRPALLTRFFVQDNSAGYTQSPMPMPIGYHLSAADHLALAAAFERENLIYTRDLLASPPPQSSTFRVHLPQLQLQPQPHHLSNIHPNSVPSQSEPLPQSQSVPFTDPSHPPIEDREQRRAPPREVCINWLRGRCYKRAEFCNYLHEENAPRRPSEYVCVKWLKGECDKSDCIYRHNKDAPRSRCMFWAHEGRCPHAKCEFSHEVGRPCMGIFVL